MAGKTGFFALPAIMVRVIIFRDGVFLFDTFLKRMHKVIEMVIFGSDGPFDFKRNYGGLSAIIISRFSSVALRLSLRQISRSRAIAEAFRIIRCPAI